jgi:hypothetical protein
MSALVAIYAVASAGHSGQEFVDEAGKYSITLAAGWQPVTYTDAIGHAKTEFIYRERGEGLLRISKEDLQDRSLADVVRMEVEGLKLCQSGVTVGGDEEFLGVRLAGRRLAFCYIEGSRWVAATYYFLEDRGAVWILRFTGRMGVLDTMRTTTDQIARSFCPL